MIDAAGAELAEEHLAAQALNVLYDKRPEVKDVVARDVVTCLENYRLGAEQRTLDRHAQTAWSGANDQHLP